MKPFQFSRNVSAEGRNGIFKASGIVLTHDEGEGRIRFINITSKGAPARGSIALPDDPDILRELGQALLNQADYITRAKASAGS